MKNLPAIFLTLVAGMVETLRTELEEGNEVLAGAIIGNTATYTLSGVPFVFHNERDKEIASEVIRMVVKDIAADFVFIITDCWTLPVEDRRDIKGLLEKYGSLSNCPSRLDSISFSLETSDAIWLSIVNIRQLDNGKRTFDDPVFERPSGVEGRFVGLLSLQRPSDSTLN